MLKRIFTVLVFLILAVQSFSQTLHLQEVEFSGNGYLGIRDDTLLSVYPSPQWTPLESFPVAIASGNALRTWAKFSSSGTLPGTVMIKATSTDNYEFPIATVSTSNPNNIEYPLSQSLTAFPFHKVKYYDPFTVSWEVSMNNGATWQSAGISENKLYVTFQNPIPESAFNDKYQHSLIEISCRNAADDSTGNDIIDDVWNEFTDRIVIDWNGDTLGYYTGDVNNAPNFNLIMENFGVCNQWASLFMDLLKIQGLNYADSYIDLASFLYDPTVCGDPSWAYSIFLLNNHTVNTPSGSPITCPTFPYLNVMDVSNFTYLYAEISDSIGFPGQNNSNPPPYFGGHTLVLLNGVYYDPSYGVTYAQLNDFKLNSLSGFGIIDNHRTEVELGVDVNQDNMLDNTIEYTAVKITTDLSLGDFHEYKSTYGDLPTGYGDLPAVSQNTVSQLHLFPNPARSFITLKNLLPERESMHLELFDSYGKLIWSTNYLVNNKQLMINVDVLKPGMYFVKAGNSMVNFVKY